MYGYMSVGRHNDRRESYGHSLIIDPWGEVLSQCSIHTPTITTTTATPTATVSTTPPTSATASTTKFPPKINDRADVSDLTNLISHEVIEGVGEICYAVYDRVRHKEIREQMPLKVRLFYFNHQ